MSPPRTLPAQAHARAFPAGERRPRVPRLSHDRARFEDADLQAGEVLVLEGTYVGRLDLPMVRVLLERDYRDTRADRVRRARDPIDELTDRVLAIEHELVVARRARADIIVDRSFRARPAPGRAGIDLAAGPSGAGSPPTAG